MALTTSAYQDQSLSPSIAMASEESPISDRFSLKIVESEAWDEAVSGFQGVCHEQLFAFVKHRWSGVGCEPALILNQGDAVAGALMMVRRLPLGLGTIAFSKWGPILKDNEASDAGQTFAHAVEALKKEYADQRKMMLSLLPRAPREPFTESQSILAEHGFKSGPQLFAAPDRYLVKIGLDDEELTKSFSQKWRYHLKKSKKQDLTFEHATTDQFHEFEKLYRIMIARKDFDDVSAYDDTISVLMQIDHPNLRPEIFLVRQGEEVVAGALIFKAGDTAEYLYGATNDKALSLRAGYFLQWNVARWLRDNTNVKWYDLGGTNNVQGLHQFKKGMVGSAGVISSIPPIANYASHIWPHVVGSLTYQAREIAAQAQNSISKWRSK